jgi:hypothetical protein
VWFAELDIVVKLEKLSKGASVLGLVVDGPATIVDVQWIGTNVVEAFFKGPKGKVENRLLYREDEQSLELEKTGAFWAFDSDGSLFRLASEAQRIQLAHLFDPVLAVHSSDVEPLPHQILAVYAEMLPRQPLRFLLADDPGAGKTIMAGLFIRELTRTIGCTGVKATHQRRTPHGIDGGHTAAARNQRNSSMA